MGKVRHSAPRSASVDVEVIVREVPDGYALLCVQGAYFPAKLEAAGADNTALGMFTDTETKRIHCYADEEAARAALLDLICAVEGRIIVPQSAGHSGRPFAHKPLQLC